MADLRRPRDVPDELDRPWSDGSPFVPSIDSDGDGVLDTGVIDDGVDLVVGTDMDGDLLPDQVVRIGPDGLPRQVLWPGDAILDVLLGGASGLDGGP